MCCRPSAAAIAARDQSPRQFASPGHGAQRWILAQSSLETCALEPGILRSTADTAGTSRPRLGRRGAQRYARRARHGRPPVGKSTLTTVIAEHDHPARLVTLDDRATRAAALADRTGFVAGFDGNVVIDEVQRAPDLLLAIKEVVDRERRPGRFLLTVAALASRKSAGRAATSSTRSMRRPLRRSRTPHRSRGVRRARRRRRLSRGSPARGTPQADLVSRRRRFHARPRSARRLRRAQSSTPFRACCDCSPPSPRACSTTTPSPPACDCTPTRSRATPSCWRPSSSSSGSPPGAPGSVRTTSTPPNCTSS